MSSQGLHCIGDDVLAKLSVVETFPNHKTVEVLVDAADGLARADDGWGWGGCRGCFRITHISKSSEKYFYFNEEYKNNK